MMAVTHTQAIQKLQEDAATCSKELKSGAQSHVIVDVPEESVSIGGEFDDKVFSPSRLKTYNTRREKRNSHRQHWEVTRENSTTRLLVAASTQNDTSLSKVTSII